MKPVVHEFRKKYSTVSRLLLLVFFATTIGSCDAQEKQLSKEALSHKLVSLNGDMTSLSTILERHHKGKVVMIEVWASWCGDCVRAMPKLKEVQAANPDVEYVFISMDKTADKWKSGIEKHELKGDHYWEPEGMKGAFGKSIDLDWIPRYIIIDKKGNVLVYRAVETDFEKINTTLKTAVK